MSGDGIDYSDLGFPGKPETGWPEDPFDEDGYCEFCGNGKWKNHAPWCQWQDAQDALREATVEFLMSQGVTLERARFETRDKFFFDQPIPANEDGTVTFKIAHNDGPGPISGGEDA